MESENSALSRFTRSVNADEIGNGPVTMHGLVFMKVRRCPLCSLSNTDLNPISTFPHGPESSITVPWYRGSNTNPESKHDKICMIAYHQGGFFAAYNDPAAFIEARKLSAQLMKEWNAAWQANLLLLTSARSLVGVPFPSHLAPSRLKLPA